MIKSTAEISISKLCKSYGEPPSSSLALDGVSLDIIKGESCAVIGKSGSGKSTLLHCIAGLEKPDSGSLIVNQNELADLSQDEAALFRLRNIGIIFQFFNLLPTLTLYQNVILPAQLLRLPAEEAGSRAKKLMDDVGILNLIDRYPHEVSGGELQRAAIARALVNKPRLLLADEPTGNLDSASADAVLNLFKRISQEMQLTTIIVTHDLEISRKAERIIELVDGRLA